MDELEWIRAGLKKPGKTQTGLAHALGRAPSAITALLKGERALKAREIPIVAAYLEVEAPGEAEAQGQQPRPQPNVHIPVDVPHIDVSRLGGPRDVPEYGTVAGGRRGGADFRRNGELIDYAPRPPGIATRKGVYVLRVVGDSMKPRYEEGERIYIDGHREPSVGDYAVLELRPTDSGEPGDGFVKRLVRKNSKSVTVEQFNPPMELTFEREELKSFHRVIPWDELLGV